MKALSVSLALCLILASAPQAQAQGCNGGSYQGYGQPQQQGYYPNGNGNGGYINPAQIPQYGQPPVFPQGPQVGEEQYIEGDEARGFFRRDPRFAPQGRRAPIINVELFNRGYPYGYERPRIIYYALPYGGQPYGGQPYGGFQQARGYCP